MMDSFHISMTNTFYIKQHILAKIGQNVNS